MRRIRPRVGERFYIQLLFVVGITQIMCGLTSMNSGWVLVWSGIGFVIVGAAYAKFGPKVFGKKLDGDRSWLNRIILFPFLVLNVTMWHLRHRLLSREDVCNEIAPGVWLGRRPLDSELPNDVRTVVDLTAEFSATPRARKLNYICVPTLDGLAPDDRAFSQLMQRLGSCDDSVYIHCAAGHGRSAAVAAAYLVSRGLAKDLCEAEAIIKAKRPRIEINKPQRDLIDRWFAARENAA